MAASNERKLDRRELENLTCHEFLCVHTRVHVYRDPVLAFPRGRDSYTGTRVPSSTLARCTRPGKETCTPEPRSSKGVRFGLFSSFRTHSCGTRVPVPGSTHRTHTGVPMSPATNLKPFAPGAARRATKLVAALAAADGP
eukprot:1553131-Rhodomonas_salina.1